jgi:hypothetical protein
VGAGSKLPTRDEEIGLMARSFLAGDPNALVVLVDDLEHGHQGVHAEKFARYRAALDTIIPTQDQHRASVHFLVNMIEAYYFGDPAAVNEVLQTDLKVHNGDVEHIRHPKGRLKDLYAGYHEVEHGAQITARLDLQKVLDDPDTCRSLRSLFRWCTDAIGDERTEVFRLVDGACCAVTGGQIESP